MEYYNEIEQDQPKKNYFAVIPATVRYDNRLTANAKLLYGEITALTNEKGYCWASNNYFANLYGASKSTISRWISSLADAGYITVNLIYKPDSKEIAYRQIRLADIKNEHTHAQNNQGVCSEMSTGMLNNEANNNTYNNTYNNTLSKDSVAPTKKSSTESISQPLIQSNSKKAKQIKKAKDIATMKGMIYAFTQNEDIQEKLLEYFNIRLKKGLQPNQWKVILDDLREFTGGVTHIAIEKINNAIAGGYMQIIASWEKSKAPNKPSNFDNTAGRKVEAVVSMSEQEKLEFEQNLATDEDGNLLQF